MPDDLSLHRLYLLSLTHCVLMIDLSLWLFRLERLRGLSLRGFGSRGLVLLVTKHTSRTQTYHPHTDTHNTTTTSNDAILLLGT